MVELRSTSPSSRKLRKGTNFEDSEPHRKEASRSGENQTRTYKSLQSLRRYEGRAIPSPSGRKRKLDLRVSGVSRESQARQFKLPIRRNLEKQKTELKSFLLVTFCFREGNPN